jgi:hypothetical protein
LAIAASEFYASNSITVIAAICAFPALALHEPGSGTNETREHVPPDAKPFCQLLRFTASAPLSSLRYSF